MVRCSPFTAISRLLLFFLIFNFSCSFQAVILLLSSPISSSRFQTLCFSSKNLSTVFSIYVQIVLFYLLFAFCYFTSDICPRVSDLLKVKSFQVFLLSRMVLLLFNACSFSLNDEITEIHIICFFKFKPLVTLGCLFIYLFKEFCSLV